MSITAQGDKEYRALWIFVILLMVTILAMWCRITVLQDELHLLQALPVGLEKREVIKRIGSPNGIEPAQSNGRLAGIYPTQEGYSIMVYSSQGKYVRNNDVWVVLDRQDRIAAVVYPTYSLDD